jgi:hypothetical protein
MRLRPTALLIPAAVVSATAAITQASSPPVGPLPPGPKATIATDAGELVAVALPRRSGGRVWRIARAYDSSILHEVSEANVGSSVLLVFKTTGQGNATISLALTRGDRPKALEARTFKVRVR